MTGLPSHHGDTSVAVPPDLAGRGRRLRAHLALFFADHGFLRTFYRNFFEVAPGVYRCNQPSPGKLRRAAAMGVRTVINLRGATPSDHYLLECTACSGLGLRLIDFQVRSRGLPSAEVLHEARRLFREVEYPILMHCKSGADRVGFMSALYLLIHEGRPVEEAMRQLHWKYGHYRSSKTGILDRFFEVFRAHSDATGEDFFTWVDGAYDPDEIMADFQVSRWSSLLVDRILMRE